MVQNTSMKWHQYRPGFEIKRKLTLIILCLSMVAKTWFLFQGKYLLNNRKLKVRPVSIANAFDCLTAFEVALRPLQATWYDKKLPVLTSVIPSNNGATMKVIFISEEYDTWSTAKWSCGKEVAEVLGSDPWINLLIIECPAQKKLQINANATLRSVSATYSSLPTPCWFEFAPSELAACTMITGSPRELIPEWISYHFLIGFEHFYIYVNEAWNAEYDRLREELGSERVSWIPFGYNIHNKGFLFQHAMQNDCIHRAQNRVNWMSLHDVDEYFQILTPHKSFPLLLKEIEASDTSIGGIRIRNWFFGNKDEVQGNSSMFLLDRYTWRTPSEKKGREKMIVHPHNVQFVTVHKINLGGRMVVPNATAVVRMNHYKLAWNGVFGYDVTSNPKKKFKKWGFYPESEKFKLVKDTSMRKYVPEMKAFLQSHH